MMSVDIARARTGGAVGIRTRSCTAEDAKTTVMPTSGKYKDAASAAQH